MTFKFIDNKENINTKKLIGWDLHTILLIHASIDNLHTHLEKVQRKY